MQFVGAAEYDPPGEIANHKPVLLCPAQLSQCMWESSLWCDDPDGSAVYSIRNQYTQYRISVLSTESGPCMGLLAVGSNCFSLMKYVVDLLPPGLIADAEQLNSETKFEIQWPNLPGVVW